MSPRAMELVSERGDPVAFRRCQFDRYEWSMPMSVLSIVRPVTSCAVVGGNERLSGLEARLSTLGFACVHLDSCHGVIDRFRAAAVDVILLMELHRNTGIAELVQKIRSNPATERTPLVVIGPRSDDEMVDALVAGADVYLDEAAAFDLMVARIRALMRRISCVQRLAENQFFGAYVFSAGSDRVSVDGMSIGLTRMEYRAALLLFSRLSSVVTFGELWMTMWEGVSLQDPQRHNVCVHISRLRTKLKLTGEHGYRLISVRGTGYTLAAVDMEHAVSSRAVNY